MIKKQYLFKYKTKRGHEGTVQVTSNNIFSARLRARKVLVVHHDGNIGPEDIEFTSVQIYVDHAPKP